VQKQVWLFLTEEDERALIARLSERHPVHLLPGRFFQGSVEALRAGEPLPTRQARRTEQVSFLIHRELSRALVFDELTEGPYAGWRRLDEARSEVAMLVRPLPEPQGLAPGRLLAATHAWFGGTRLRKSAEFGRWVNEILETAAAYPRTAFDWLHVAPGAAAAAESGACPLHYLYKPVGLTPEGEATPATRPHQGR
jgi:hypothetical protein